jgi:hypothetical protein
MLNRLSGWQRIGVVLTGLWLIFVLLSGAVGYTSLDSGHGPFIGTIKGKVPHCAAPAPESQPEKKTFTFEEAWGCAPGAFVEGTPDKHYFKWGALIAAASVPVIFAWLFAYLLIALVRWVAKGFRCKAT